MRKNKYCRFCGRPLKDPDSIARGAGPLCAERGGKKPPVYPENQLRLHLEPLSMKDLSPTMEATIDRLRLGSGDIVPFKGGYWLPSETLRQEAVELRESDRELFDLNRNEFGCHVSTTTVLALARRGILIQTASKGVGFHKSNQYPACFVHRLAPEYNEYPSHIEERLKRSMK